MKNYATKKLILILLGLFFSIWSFGSLTYSTPSLENPSNLPNKNIIQSPYPIIFIHGIAGGFQDWQPMIDKLSSTSFKMGPLFEDEFFHNYMNTPPKNELWLWNITYYTPNPIVESFTGNLSQYSFRLQKMITAIMTITKKNKVILIAHSMGGLVAQNYMIQSQKNWDTVHKIVTVATPFTGVSTSIGIVGQLEDLRQGSRFIKTLHQKWAQFYQLTEKKWGVIGAIDTQLHKTDPPFQETNSDGGGPGYITLSSSIPFGEWHDAFNVHFLQVRYNTTHFGFRQAVIGHHKFLVDHPSVLGAIRWAVLD